MSKSPKKYKRNLISWLAGLQIGFVPFFILLFIAGWGALVLIKGQFPTNEPTVERVPGQEQ